MKIDLNDEEINRWIEAGIKDNYNYLLIVFDLESREYFPVFFHSYLDVIRYRQNIISESKLEAKQDYKLFGEINGTT